jgi:hypothetical protein
MNWKTIETVSIVNTEGVTENIHIQHDGNFYKIQNEFGNMSFEFDISSGFNFADTLQAIITSDINNEITQFLNKQDARDSQGSNDYVNGTPSQVGLFENVKSINNKNNGLNIKLNKTSKKITK